MSKCGCVTTVLLSFQKGLLCDAVEDHAEYEPPQQGNLIYKLFSLGEMLVLVRCAVQKVKMRPHNKKAKNRRVS